MEAHIGAKRRGFEATHGFDQGHLNVPMQSVPAIRFLKDLIVGASALKAARDASDKATAAPVAGHGRRDRQAAQER